MECRSLREPGAAWASCDFRDVHGKADGAVLFAPSGKLVPPTLEYSIAAGFAPPLAFISVTCRPSTTAGIYQERELLSVTANTREDFRALLAEAVEAHVQPQTRASALTDANRGLHDMEAQQDRRYTCARDA
jgi:alcohol dehydrogenase, propanol-preferring